MLIKKYWSNIFWSSNALMMVQDIKASLNEWSTYFDLENIYRRFSKPSWKISWNTKSSNKLANLVAKKL